MQNRCRGVVLTRCASHLFLNISLQRWRRPLPIGNRCVLPRQICHLLHEPCALHLSLQKQSTRCANCRSTTFAALLSIQTVACCTLQPVLYLNTTRWLSYIKLPCSTSQALIFGAFGTSYQLLSMSQRRRLH